MSIRLPLTTILDYNDSGNTGATSVVSKTFILPQDTDNVILKVPVASINGGGSADIFFQTSDDGGTTFYDVARLPLITGTIANAGAFFASIPVISMGVRSSSAPVASAAGGTTQTSVLTVTGNASIRGLAAGTISGLPILGQLNQVQISYSGTITGNNGVQVQVKVNSQGAQAS